ncbi:MAG TPA: hypothetical protein GX693_06395 [Firmicutes bacterium]|nr:hypothetical protein [Bacillota bacterium]
MLREITVIDDTPPELKDEPLDKQIIELEESKFYRIVKTVDNSNISKPVYEVIEVLNKSI